WTRELIDAVLEVGGTYYLPYQSHATPEQFHSAYPRAVELFALKQMLDPEFRFRNILWDSYYAPWLRRQSSALPSGSEFRDVFFDTTRGDKFYLFLQNVFHLFPEHRFYRLIAENCVHQSEDREIYNLVQTGLPGIAPPLAPLTYALPALRKQKREMAQQTLELLGTRRRFNGYLEIGTVGRYISALRGDITVDGPIYIMNDIAPGNSPADIMERGRVRRLGEFCVLDYTPVETKGIAPGSLDLITCFIGLHHAPLDLLDGFVRSLHGALRPGGMLIMRDHDVRTPQMATFVSLVHTVFNLGLGVPWETDSREFKAFRPVDEWSAYLAERGFRDHGARLRQQGDPSDNLLMAFVKDDLREVA
ncbi:MAG: FAD-binding oxidoreductase, partial [Bacteroidota bacterium]